jgi:hypothetical protein
VKALRWARWTLYTLGPICLLLVEDLWGKRWLGI